MRYSAVGLQEGYTKPAVNPPVRRLADRDALPPLLPEILVGLQGLEPANSKSS